MSPSTAEIGGCVSVDTYISRIGPKRAKPLLEFSLNRIGMHLRVYHYSHVEMMKLTAAETCHPHPLSLSFADPCQYLCCNSLRF